MTELEPVATPRVFVSYSGDDWDRFVGGFATRLRCQGVDAWVAEWEIPAGGSLVRKIFVEGLGKADTVIIVLSETSVTKPWVAEELDIAVVRRIEDQTNLIPVRIDNCPIPEPLRATKRITIRNLDDYDSEFSAIVESIFGVSQRPEMGPPPTWTIPKPRTFTGLNNIDEIVLSTFCEFAMASGNLNISVRELQSTFESHQLSTEQVTRSIQRLIAYYYVQGQRVMSGEYSHVQISIDVFANYAEQVFPEMNRVLGELVAEIASCPPDNIITLRPPDDVPAAVFQTIIRLLERQGLFHLRWMWSGEAMISGISPRIEEYLEK